tara:strand:+ start:18132 stop:18530 length:399 start_codon:yes stop_codon:yes gene_type:complete
MVELLPAWVIVCTVCGAFVGISSGNLELGVFWGSVVGWTPVGLLYVIGIWNYFFVREHPQCRCGCNRDGCFDFIGIKGSPPDQFDYRCLQCWRFYRQRKNIRFEIDTDGNEVPYAKQRGLLPWKILDGDELV